VIHEAAPAAQDMTSRRVKTKRCVNEEQKRKNRTNPHFSQARLGSFCGDLEKDLERPSFHGITALSRRGFCRVEAAFLMTECTQETFAFTAHFSRRVEAGFTAGQVSTDDGALLLREVDRKINVMGRPAGCFTDGR
jgi:hypothetical protein